MDDKVRENIDRLMADPEFYREKSRQESITWGAILTDERQSQELEAEQDAARALDLYRHHIHIIPTLKKHGLTPESGLSLACGNGRIERFLIQSGICRTFHGLDISETALAAARKLAAKEGLSPTYEQADLNDISLPADTYDFVVTRNCLHHILKLEHLAEQIHLTLKPGGALWISDFIGETQFQFTEQRLDIVNRILAALPVKYRMDTINNRTLEKLVRPEPGAHVSPFEAIRSADIMPVFLNYFDIIEKREYDSILRFVCPPGVRQAYNEDETSRALFETIMMLDELLIEQNILTPVAGSYLLKAKE